MLTLAGMLTLGGEVIVLVTVVFACRALDSIGDYFDALASRTNNESELLEFDIETLEADQEYEEEQLDLKKVELRKREKSLEYRAQALELLYDGLEGLLNDLEAKTQPAESGTEQPTATDGCKFHTAPEPTMPTPGLDDQPVVETSNASNSVPASEDGSGQQSASV